MDLRDAIKIYCENIAEFSRRQRISDSQRKIMVNELLAHFVTGSSDIGAREVCRKFRELLPEQTCEDRARLCMALGASSAHSAEKRKNRFFGEEIAAGLHGKVSLVRNSYNELALSRLSAVITRPKGVFSPTFVSACEDVYNSRSEFCILPVENSQSGRLFGFYSMLDRYELRICAVCELESEGDSGGSVKYALVGRSLPDRIPKNSRWSFEFTVISEDGRIFFDILRVCEVFGAKLVKIDSLPVEYDERLQKYYFTFRLPDANITAFDLFLSEEYARYTAVGLFPTV